MPASVPRSRAALAAVAVAALAALPGAAAPGRVVSMNLCTDQLALMLAAPGQVISVSALARDPRLSAVAEAATGLPANHGRAEEIFLMRPDLVITGTFTTPATVEMLRGLGIEVATLAPAASLDDVRRNIAEVGALLGREAAAARLIAAFDRDLARLRHDAAARPRAALYQAQGYTAGDDSLAGEMLDAAGLDNVAAEAGLAGGGFLPLEALVALAPEIVVKGSPEPGASRAEEVLSHPALRGARAEATMADREWMCGTPEVVAAIVRLAELRQRVPKGR